MKILFLYPFGTHRRVRTEEDASQAPIGLYYLGAVLKEKGHEVDIWNWHDHSQDPESIKTELLQHTPDVIGISVFQANRHGAIQIAQIAKKVLPKTKIVFGGVGASTLWEFFLTHVSAVDIITLGEAETSFPLLLEALSQKNPELNTVPGIVFRENSTFTQTLPTPPVELDELPDPALYYTFNHVISSRGCPGGCRFCGSPQLWGRKVRAHSADGFVSHLERLYQKGVRFFFISDDTFTLQKDRVISICKEILRRNLQIEWAAISRVDCVDVEILTWMRKAGCIQISYGVESAIPSIREWLGKKISHTDILNAFLMAISVGILPRAYIIYGTPEESKDTAAITLEKLKEWKALAAIFYMLEVFPGTALYEETKKRISLSHDYWQNDVESLAWAETVSKDAIETALYVGKELRKGYAQILPEMVRDLSFLEDDTLKPYQANFLSRLGVTFSHGEYAHVPTARETAKMLLEKALSFSPNTRAFWGKGLIAHEEGDFPLAVKTYQQGLSFFPEDPLLHIYLGYSYLAQNKFQEALPHFEKFQDHPDAKSGLFQVKQQLERS